VDPEKVWQCQTTNCGYFYNPDKGDRKGKIPKGTNFEDIPNHWKCPVCGASKKAFRSLAGPGAVDWQVLLIYSRTCLIILLDILTNPLTQDGKACAFFILKVL